MQVLKRNQMESPVKLEEESVNVLLPLVPQLQPNVYNLAQREPG